MALLIIWKMLEKFCSQWYSFGLPRSQDEGSSFRDSPGSAGIFLEKPWSFSFLRDVFSPKQKWRSNLYRRMTVIYRWKRKKKNKQGVGVKSQESVVPNDNGSINAKVGRSFHKKMTKKTMKLAVWKHQLVVVLIFWGRREKWMERHRRRTRLGNV